VESVPDWSAQLFPPELLQALRLAPCQHPRLELLVPLQAPLQGPALRSDLVALGVHLAEPAPSGDSVQVPVAQRAAM
jgi:hypothetical protein